MNRVWWVMKVVKTLVIGFTFALLLVFGSIETTNSNQITKKDPGNVGASFEGNFTKKDPGNVGDSLEENFINNRKKDPGNIG